MSLPSQLNDTIRALVADLFAPVREAVEAGAKEESLNDCIKQHITFEKADDLVYEVMERLRQEGLLIPCDNVGDRDYESADFWNRFVEHGLDPTAPDFARSKALLSDHFLKRVMNIRAGAGLRGFVGNITTKAAARRHVRDMEAEIVDFMASGTVNGMTGGRELLTCPFTDEKLAIEIHDWKMVVVGRRSAEPVAPIYRADVAHQNHEDSGSKPGFK